MFSIFIRKKSIVKLLSAILVLAIAVSGAVYFALESKQTNVEPTNRLQVVVDAGHGGVDGGAIGYSGTIEKEINLQIALKVRDMLCLSACDVVMTREIDESIHDDDADTIRAKKRSDLENRLEIIQANPNSITVSIHQNIFSQSRYSGPQLYYSPNNPQSEVLAGIVQSKFQELISSEYNRDLKPAGSNLFLMYNATTPMVLVECGFLSNPEDEEKLKSDDYQNKIAFTICASVLQYMQENHKKI